MILREQMFDPLLLADPSFAPVWKAVCDEWRDQPDRPVYSGLSELARHLIQKLERGETSCFKSVFAVVERWHLEGDAFVKEAATIGLLEDLQNLNLHNTTSPDDLLPWLEPETQRWWRKIAEFWDNGTLVSDN